MRRPIMTKEEARAWKERWRLVNEIERQELRAMTPIEKLRQLATMMEAARDFGWQTSTPEEIEAIRARWRRLRGQVSAA